MRLESWAAPEYSRDRVNAAGAETVLVRVDSVGALRRAYPNYFADTSVFLGELRRAIGEG